MTAPDKELIIVRSLTDSDLGLFAAHRAVLLSKQPQLRQRRRLSVSEDAENTTFFVKLVQDQIHYFYSAIRPIQTKLDAPKIPYAVRIRKQPMRVRKGRILRKFDSLRPNQLGDRPQ